MQTPEKLDIASSFKNYSVTFEASVSDAILAASPRGKRIFFLVDSNLPPIQEELANLLRSSPTLNLSATEENKSIETVKHVCNWLLNQGADKSAHLIAVGGGVIQDIATFTSHIFYRGISWSMLPTTLLAMADSSIGGKCAINLDGFKNQLGVIHPPNHVSIFSGFLGSLPEQEVQSGFGEILKLSLTGDLEFYDEFKIRVEEFGLSKIGINDLIWLSLNAKKTIIEIDESEGNLRRVLNYGHTFGHALESASAHAVTHGQAIVFGMDVINFIGRKLGHTDSHFEVDFREFAAKNFHLRALVQQASLHIDSLFSLISRDKKVLNGEVHFAFAQSKGRLHIEPVRLDQNLKNLLNEYFQQ